MSKLSKKFNNLGRKIIVKLKYHPNILPMIILVIGFVVFSLNLTNVSESTLYVGKKNMGLYCFISYLLSILSMVCLLNTFPKREKVKIPFLVLTIIMLIVIVLVDGLYIAYIDDIYMQANRGELVLDEIRINQLSSAKTSFIVNIAMEVLGLILLILVPVIKKALSKINTRVNFAENTNITSIDISEE